MGRVVKHGRKLGDNDVNVGEIYAILDVIYRLVDYEREDRIGTQVHIFSDSDTTVKLLTDPGRVSKYYWLVQRVRRLAANMKYEFILHWIPSHLDRAGKEFEIHGNTVADSLAREAALLSRSTSYVCPQNGLDNIKVHKEIMSATARLVHDIEKLFPREHGPASSTCEVPSYEVKPGGKSEVT